MLLQEVTWEKDGLTYTLKEADLPIPGGAYWCGYVRFPEIPVQSGKETFANPFLINGGEFTIWYGGILRSVPVHGGITYGQPDDQGGITYGFDCAHYGDSERPELHDIAYLKKECENMGRAIRLAAKYDTRYLAAQTDEEREAIETEYGEAMLAFQK